MNKQTMSSVRKQAQQGFTLIELIVVIVILGILAATALPKFADMGGDARVAAINAARGALNATAATVHGQSLLNPSATTVTNEGVQVTITNTYPAADANTASAAGLTTPDWIVIPPGTAANSTNNSHNPATTANQIAVIPGSLTNAPAAATCYVLYQGATISGGTVTPPSVTVPTPTC